MYKVIPYLEPKPWGGNALKKLSPKTNKEEVLIGEAFIFSDIPKKESCLIIDDKMKKLNDVYEKNPNLFGNYPQGSCPLLIKLIEANDDLSIQVHPNDEWAKILEGEDCGKSEAWYILSSNPDSELILGTIAKSPSDIKLALANKDMDKVFVRKTIKPNQTYYVEAGLVHALLKGVIVYEIQQPSNTTYRIYDYDRLFNGKLRELHLNNALKTIKYNTVTKPIFPKKTSFNPNIKELINNEKFSLFIFENKTNSDVIIPIMSMYFYVITNISEQEVKINEITILPSETYFVPKEKLGNLSVEGQAKLLIALPPEPILTSS